MEITKKNRTFLSWCSTESISLALEQLNEILKPYKCELITFNFNDEGYYKLFIGDEEIISIKGFKHFVDAIKMFSYSMIYLKEKGVFLKK